MRWNFWRTSAGGVIRTLSPRETGREPERGDFKRATSPLPGLPSRKPEGRCLLLPFPLLHFAEARERERRVLF